MNRLELRKRFKELRLGTASIIAVLALTAVLVVLIAPSVDLDDIVIRAGQLFLGLILAIDLAEIYHCRFVPNLSRACFGLFVITELLASCSPDKVSTMRC
jgi:hypothetical protein